MTSRAGSVSGGGANAGQISSAGRVGSAGESVGNAGASAGNAGSASSSGAAAAAGALGGAGSPSQGGTGGAVSASAGASGVGGAGTSGSAGSGPAPTFTRIYDTIITPTCGGAQCHLKRPTPFGYDFSSKSAASESWRADVIPGDGAGSPMFQVLNFGIMPKDKPVLSVEQLYLVYDWINAGALDD